jgi:hypothetical protein
MLSELSFLQFYLSINGIFVRGALATGYHFENERMIFSEGLINAYELHKGDYYPRILIDALLIKKISDDSQSNMMTPYVIMGPDGRYFLDYLQRLEEDGSGDIDDLFEAHKDAILKELNANIGNYKIVEKYRWLAEYHNHKFNEFYKSDDWVEDYFSELQEKLYIPMTYFPTFKKEIAAFTKL